MVKNMDKQEVLELVKQLPLTSIHALCEFLRERGWDDECDEATWEEVSWFFTKENFRIYYHFDHYCNLVSLSAYMSEKENEDDYDEDDYDEDDTEIYYANYKYELRKD